MKVLVTGGAGFVGAGVATALAERHPSWEVVALDSLHRRGSELSLPRLRSAGVGFVHGDVRDASDLEGITGVETIIECSAEPSVLAGTDGRTDFLVKTNVLGAYNCLELARREGAQMIFLSTSRVYPVEALRRLRLVEASTRFELDLEQPVVGASSLGISESFPLTGARTLYGASKLAAELLVIEFGDVFGLLTAINRCGVLAGPGQMGNSGQGVFTYWLLAHYFRRPLAYIGYGGSGKQARDLLHIDDLTSLIDDQIMRPEAWRGAVFNVGGGRDCSLSLRETTALCRELTGHAVEITPHRDQRAGDVPVYLSDCRGLYEQTSWRPTRSATEILSDTLDWIRTNERGLELALEWDG